MRKSILYGGICLASFIFTAAAYHPVHGQLEVEATESVSAPSSPTEQNQPLLGQEEEDEKATSLIAVTTKRCPPCRRLKYLTITILLAEGYDVSIILGEDWNGPTPDKFPVLYYLDDDGRIIRKETGFRTAAHIKKYLTK